MKKIITIFLLLFLAISVNALTNYTKTPISCPSSDSTNFPGQSCLNPSLPNILGNNSGILVCGSGSSITIPSTYNPSFQAQVSTALATGYVYNCYADGTTPNTTWACDINSTCNSSWNRDSECQSTTVATCSSSCRANYYSCGANPDICNVHQGDSCSVGGLAGTYNGCTCVTTPQYFITSTQATYASDINRPFLWGKDFGDGNLITIQNDWNQGFYVDKNGNARLTKDLNLGGNLKVDGNYLCNSTTCYLINDLNKFNTASTDTNWQTSWVAFDLNQKRIYVRQSDANSWFVRQSDANSWFIQSESDPIYSANPYATSMDQYVNTTADTTFNSVYAQTLTSNSTTTTNTGSGNQVIIQDFSRDGDPVPAINFVDAFNGSNGNIGLSSSTFTLWGATWDAALSSLNANNISADGTMSASSYFGTWAGGVIQSNYLPISDFNKWYVRQSDANSWFVRQSDANGWFARMNASNTGDFNVTKNLRSDVNQLCAGAYCYNINDLNKIFTNPTVSAGKQGNIQYNDSNVLNGVSDLNWEQSTKKLWVNGDVNIGHDLNVNNIARFRMSNARTATEYYDDYASFGASVPVSRIQPGLASWAQMSSHTIYLSKLDDNVGSNVGLLSWNPRFRDQSGADFEIWTRSLYSSLGTTISRKLVINGYGWMGLGTNNTSPIATVDVDGNFVARTDANIGRDLNVGRTLNVLSNAIIFTDLNIGRDANAGGVLRSDANKLCASSVCYNINDLNKIFPAPATASGKQGNIQYNDRNLLNGVDDLNWNQSNLLLRVNGDLNVNRDLNVSRNLWLNGTPIQNDKNIMGSPRAGVMHINYTYGTTPDTPEQAGIWSDANLQGRHDFSSYISANPYATPADVYDLIFFGISSTISNGGNINVAHAGVASGGDVVNNSAYYRVLINPADTNLTKRPIGPYENFRGIGSLGGLILTAYPSWVDENNQLTGVLANIESYDAGGGVNYESPYITAFTARTRFCNSCLAGSFEGMVNIQNARDESSSDAYTPSHYSLLALRTTDEARSLVTGLQFLKYDSTNQRRGYIVDRDGNGLQIWSGNQSNLYLSPFRQLSIGLPADIAPNFNTTLQIHDNNSNRYGPFIQFTDDSTGTAPADGFLFGRYNNTYGGDVIIWNRESTGGINFGTNNAQTAYLDKNGDFGLGVNPSSRLDVNGTITSEGVSLVFLKNVIGRNVTELYTISDPIITGSYLTSAKRGTVGDYNTIPLQITNKQTTIYVGTDQNNTKLGFYLDLNHTIDLNGFVGIDGFPIGYNKFLMDGRARGELFVTDDNTYSIKNFQIQSLTHFDATTFFVNDITMVSNTFKMVSGTYQGNLVNSLWVRNNGLVQIWNDLNVDKNIRTNCVFFSDGNKICRGTDYLGGSVTKASLNGTANQLSISGSGKILDANLTLSIPTLFAVNNATFTGDSSTAEVFNVTGATRSDDYAQSITLQSGSGAADRSSGGYMQLFAGNGADMDEILYETRGGGTWVGKAGNGGSTLGNDSVMASNGGDASLYGGTGGAGVEGFSNSGSGGNVNIIGGNAYYEGTGGNVNITAGDSDLGTDGVINLNGATTVNHNLSVTGGATITGSITSTSYLATLHSLKVNNDTNIVGLIRSDRNVLCAGSVCYNIHDLNKVFTSPAIAKGNQGNIQYNDVNVLNGVSDFNWENSARKLWVNGDINIGRDLNIGKIARFGATNLITPIELLDNYGSFGANITHQKIKPGTASWSQMASHFEIFNQLDDNVGTGVGYIGWNPRFSAQSGADFELWTRSQYSGSITRRIIINSAGMGLGPNNTSPIATVDVDGNFVARTDANIGRDLLVGRDLNIAGNIVQTSNPPTLKFFAGAGTSPSGYTYGGARDGNVSITTGTIPSGTNAVVASLDYGTLCPTSSFGSLTTPLNSTTAALSGLTMVYVSDANRGSFRITSGTTALTASTTYAWTYHIACK